MATAPVISSRHPANGSAHMHCPRSCPRAPSGGPCLGIRAFTRCAATFCTYHRWMSHHNVPRHIEYGPRLSVCRDRAVSRTHSQPCATFDMTEPSENCPLRCHPGTAVPTAYLYVFGTDPINFGRQTFLFAENPNSAAQPGIHTISTFHIRHARCVITDLTSRVADRSAPQLPLDRRIWSGTSSTWATSGNSC